MSEQFLYFLQQMFNGVTLGSTYALIAIGYTMVYGIIGMINFAHGEVYMIGSYVSFMIIAALMMLDPTFQSDSQPNQSSIVLKCECKGTTFF